MSIQNSQTKVAVSVSEMARMTGLSRARFYQLMSGGCFPKPSYDPDTGRPYFDESQQVICLDVRRRNCGIDGKPILFYARRVEVRPSAHTTRKANVPVDGPTAKSPLFDILEAVKALGLTSATYAQIRNSVALWYPQGLAGIDQGEVIKQVFVHLKRQDSSDNVGR